MTEERARLLSIKYFGTWAAADAILAACAEERRAALTEAAEACKRKTKYSKHQTNGGPYSWGCHDCAEAIERLRDTPEARDAALSQQTVQREQLL